MDYSLLITGGGEGGGIGGFRMSHYEIYLIPPPPHKALQYSYYRWRLMAVTFYSLPCIPVGTNDPPLFPLKTMWSPKYSPPFPAKVMNKE